MKHSTIASKLKQIGVVGIWIIVWQMVYLKVGKEVLVPSPLQTVSAFLSMARYTKFYLQILYTFQRVIIGILVCLTAGMGTAVLSYYCKGVELFIRPVMTFMKSTPVMAIIILAIFWFPSNQVPIFVCFLMCYPIVYTNVLEGLRQMDSNLIELNKVYQVKWHLYMKQCYLPQLRPYLYAALDLSMGMAWKVVIAAEVLSIPKYSIGYALMDAKRYLETSEVFAWMAVIILLSEVCQRCVHLMIRRR